MATAKKPAAKRSASKAPSTAVMTESVVVSEAPTTVAASVAQRSAVSLTDLVCVQSCFHGNLFYKSKRNGSIVEWQSFGEEQFMDVDELMYMRNTQPTFFKEQWVRLVGDNADAVFEFLHLDRYCKNNLKFDTFDDVFAMDPDDLIAVVKGFAPSLRNSFARRAKELIEDGSINQLTTIKAIERATGYDLLE